MDDKHLLNLNPFKVLKCLAGTISTIEQDKIRHAISDNGRELVALAESHLSYAETFAGDDCWRQKVSRGYYSCYAASRAVRLIVHGVYDVEVGDHKKIGELPDDFPDRAVWSDLLTKFRGDRNIADYDHTVGEGALEMDSDAYVAKAKDFVEAAKAYLRDRGMI